MTAMSSTLLRWLARRLDEAVCRAVALWAVDTCNTDPSALRPRQRIGIRATRRFATGI